MVDWLKMPPPTSTGGKVNTGFSANNAGAVKDTSSPFGLNKHAVAALGNNFQFNDSIIPKGCRQLGIG